MEYSAPMNFRQFVEREKYVALHAQSWRFRAVKYAILLPLFAGMVWWQGWQATGVLFLVLFVAALCVHFFFRWKTNAWTRSWGLYKKLGLPE